MRTSIFSMVGLLLAGLFFGLTFNGCNETEPQADALLAERQEKDEYFAGAPKSPIPEAERASFSGLDYFPPEKNLRFEGPIELLTEKLVDTVATSKENDLRPALRYGYFHFSHLGQKHKLLVYKFLKTKTGYEDYLFLGFTDQTTGDQTYGAGRYIDLTISPENHYIVDFNQAYNPYCAYSDAYSCPIPPAENHLPFAVTAGEKNYHKTIGH